MLIFSPLAFSISYITVPTMLRPLILAAGVCLLALQPAHQAKAQNGQADQAEANQSAPARSARDLPPARDYKADCQHPKSLEESDLCAQWVAARAAREAVLQARNANTIGADTLYWTRIGIAAVLFTLLLTALATWAAGRAAKAAIRSLTTFQTAESGMLVASVNLIDQHTVHVGAVNRGRTMAAVFHADLVCVTQLPDGPLPVAMVGGYETDLGIAEGKSYDFKPRSISQPNAIVYLIGGVLYRNVFGEFHVCKIAIELNRITGAKSIVHAADFSKWERLADRLTKGKKIRDI